MIGKSDGSKSPHIVACVQHTESMQTAWHIIRRLGKARLTAELLQVSGPGRARALARGLALLGGLCRLPPAPALTALGLPCAAAR